MDPFLISQCCNLLVEKWAPWSELMLHGISHPKDVRDSEILWMAVLLEALLVGSRKWLGLLCCT
jgi:hypothetical protein